MYAAGDDGTRRSWSFLSSVQVHCLKRGWFCDWVLCAVGEFTVELNCVVLGNRCVVFASSQASGFAGGNRHLVVDNSTSVFIRSCLFCCFGLAQTFVENQCVTRCINHKMISGGLCGVCCCYFQLVRKSVRLHCDLFDLFQFRRIQTTDCGEKCVCDD